MDDPYPLYAAVVEVTNRFNFRCPFCASDSGCARENEMSLSQTGTLTETPFYIRQLKTERIVREMVG